MAQPYAGLTVPVDITAFYQAVGARKVPFFLSFLYCAARAANGVPELRQRLRGRKILEYDHCPTSHTVALEDGTYCYCTLRSDLPFSDYLPMPSRPRKRPRPSAVWTTGERRMPCPPLHLHPALGALRGPCPAHPQPGRHQPTDHLGRFRREGDRVVLPVSLLCHHGLVDGLHMAHFYANLERELAQWVEKE